jgi:2-phosphosulfolactate phosphatase
MRRKTTGSVVQVRVHNLPQLAESAELAGSVVVAVDQLRASCTICQALAAGAKAVVPLVEVEETLSRAREYPWQEIVLGGERGGRRIEGFDLGNSPTEYTPQRVGGKTVLFTTTNGAKALAHARQARRVLVGSTLNRAAIAAALADEANVDILCAGTDGQQTREDILAAGAIVERLVSAACRLGGSAEDALSQWKEVVAAAGATGRSLGDQFALELRVTPGGRNLLAIGHDFDLETCAQLDTLEVVPELDQTSGVIRLRPT